MRDLLKLIDFQTDPGAGGDPGGGGGDPTPPAATTPPDPATAPGATTESSAAAWSGPSQEEWQQTQQTLQQVAPFMQELQQLLYEDPAQQQQQQQVPQIDPNIQQYLDAQVERMYAERFGAYEPVLGQIAEREGEQIARSTLDRLATEGGDFNRDLALVYAQQFVGQGLPPDQALQQAAQTARQIREAERTAALEEHNRAVAAAANAPTDIQAPGAATDIPATATGRDRYEETLARFQSSLRPVNPAA